MVKINYVSVCCIVAAADKVGNSKGRTERLYIRWGIQADARKTDHRRCW